MCFSECLKVTFTDYSTVSVVNQLNRRSSNWNVASLQLFGNEKMTHDQLVPSQDFIFFR